MSSPSSGLPVAAVCFLRPWIWAWPRAWLGPAMLVDPEHRLDVCLHSGACLLHSGGPPRKELPPEGTQAGEGSRALPSRPAQLMTQEQSRPLSQSAQTSWSQLPTVPLAACPSARGVPCPTWNTGLISTSQITQGDQTPKYSGYNTIGIYSSFTFWLSTDLLLFFKVL